MKKLVVLFISLLAISSVAFSQKRYVIYMDCLEPLSEYWATNDYCQQIRDLFIGEHTYDFSCIVTPSFTFEHSLGYEKESRSLVFCSVSENVYYSGRQDNQITTTCVRIPEEVGDSLSVLFSLATESSKYYNNNYRQEGDVVISVADGTRYEFAHSNGITATCHSPEDGNAYRLVNLVEAICNFVRDNDVPGIIGMQEDICSLIDGFRKVFSGSTGCSQENGKCVSFPETVKRVRQSYDDKELVDAMLGSNLYSRIFSSSDDYALLSCYILLCKSGDASEEIGKRLVEMLDKFPWKWQEMDTCWESLRKRQQKKLHRYFARIILTESSISRNDSKIDFYWKYPYLVDIRMPFQWIGEDILDYWLRTHKHK